MPGHVKAGGRIVVVPDGTTLDAVCFNCSHEISSQEAEFFVGLSRTVSAAPHPTLDGDYPERCQWAQDDICGPLNQRFGLERTT
jgi:hypothetical protein